MRAALNRVDATPLRQLTGWTIFVAGTLHGLAQALPLLARGL